MKEGIHPPYYQATITCSCGAEYHVGSTKQHMHVEVCSRCHPFYTGEQRMVDTGGRVERFKKRYHLD
ncbi:ribosomal protein L31 [Candidatus Hydrogenisulfobacillus filiaventi]|uniref:Large ribosomal subunit protein bL31 n=1 Tax=Candidatus Hydrogenisulfobacillus filiaventi TaxID=2707344 RepID=A0A6F8ZE30_9FIRM|nr:50S ribosomal protein L31 [Bacillota bacterium]CAB1128128.1 ribosomal protein L31 [Candidatus Hydrogenisulfobacillus filiaventi]